MKRKTLVFLFIWIVLFKSISYADAPSGWAAGDIEAIEILGLTTESLQNGYASKITRSEFSELIVKTYKLITEQTSIEIPELNPFVDSDASFVLEAYAIGLMKGTDDDHFTPEGFLTREQMVVAMIRMVNLVESELGIVLQDNIVPGSYEDVNQISTWAYESMIGAIQYGIISGIGNNQLSPLTQTTKEQVLITNYRLVRLMEGQNVAISDDVLQEIITGPTGLVTASSLNLRSEPDESLDNVITRLDQGARVDVINHIGVWYQVRTSDLTEGYVHEDYIYIYDDQENSGSLANEIREFSIQFVGTPYQYGGSSLTEGTDCAGFTQSIFEVFGISLSRSSAGQGSDGIGISESELLIGDLVTYGYNGVISHVALYIGNGQVIHATTSYGVKITDLHGYLYKPLIGFRRVIL